MSGARHWEQDKEATVYVGNLDERVSDALVWELMLQAGRIVNIHLPKDRVSQSHQGYGFVEFMSEEDADYAARIMNQVRLYGKPIRVNKASADKQKTAEVGAELFVGNLDAMVDEKTLYDTFSRFGSLVAAPKIARDEAGLSKGYGFVSFSNFEASDDAVLNMNGQYLMNKEVSVQYAFKKDGKGERHGDQAERMLAAQARKHNVQPIMQQLPPQLFNAAPTPTPTAPAAMLLEAGDGSGAMGGGAGAGGRAWNGSVAMHPPPPTGGAPPLYLNGGGSGGARPGMPNGFYDGGGGGGPPMRPPPPLSAPSMASAASLMPPAALPGLPPTGLPARPPPSLGGYNGPQGFVPPGFGAAGNNPLPPGAYAPPPPGPPGGPPPGMTAPLGFGAPPPAPPPGMGRGLPPGFGPPPPLAPPGPLPPGFQQAYGRGM
ncbi:MAG: hypothetical protein M1826_007230 [Phylliscum demangeonii]|nr:MAG: hypothetical protein M1826_007230 [Phylliscum demangeonii]